VPPNLRKNTHTCWSNSQHFPSYVWSSASMFADTAQYTEAVSQAPREETGGVYRRVPYYAEILCAWVLWVARVHTGIRRNTSRAWTVLRGWITSKEPTKFNLWRKASSPAIWTSPPSYNTNVHYRGHKRQPLEPILTQLSSVDIFKHDLSKIRFNNSYPNLICRMACWLQFLGPVFSVIFHFSPVCAAFPPVSSSFI
jgi:hypothetical protein